MKITTGHDNTLVTTRLDAMPDQPKTPGRLIRLDDELWFKFKAKAEREGTNASAKIRAYMERDIQDATPDDPQ